MLGFMRMLQGMFLSGNYRSFTFDAPWLMATSPLLSALLLLLFRSWAYAALMVFPVAWWVISVPVLSPLHRSDGDTSRELHLDAWQRTLVWTSVGVTSVAAALSLTRLLDGPHPTSHIWWWPIPPLVAASLLACGVTNLGVCLVIGTLASLTGKQGMQGR
jgi:hypothetical protein